MLGHLIEGLDVPSLFPPDPLRPLYVLLINPFLEEEKTVIGILCFLGGRGLQEGGGDVLVHQGQVRVAARGVQG